MRRAGSLLVSLLLTSPRSLASSASFSSSLTQMFSRFNKATMVAEEQALPGRDAPMQLGNTHYVLKTPLQPPFPPDMQRVVFGTGCFWGTERIYYSKVPGVYSTAVGYTAGFTKNPTYQEVCTGRTGHNEVVHVVYDPAKVSFADLLKTFWESHNPTQGMRQGPDTGTQYRSGIYYFTEEQRLLAEASKKAYQQALQDGGISAAITTEIIPAPTFYYAEDYHQQYLNKPGNRQYCGAEPTGVALPTPDQWDLPEEVKKAVTTNKAVWDKLWAGCVF